jgi:hypothetical protein
MRKILIAAVMGVACLMGAPAHAALDLASVQKVINSVTSKGPEYACKKANLLGGTITLRSLEGRLCSDKTIAAFTQAMCPGISSDFVGSGCDTKGKAALAGATPDSVLQAQLAKAPPVVKELACKLGTKAPANIKPVMTAACGA